MAADLSQHPLIVDANVLFSALLKDGLTRHLLLSARLNLHTPAVLWTELDRNRGYLIRKGRTTEAAFDLLVNLLRSKIQNIPDEVVDAKLDEALRRLAPTDRLDAPYVAAAMAVSGTLWTHDKVLSKGAGVPILRTVDVSKMVEG